MTTDSTDKIEVELKDYRQPLVTSLGIILGFMLSYLAGWANQAAGDQMFQDGADIAIFVTIVIAAGTLVVVLYRMLRPVPPAKTARWYALTLRLYILGIVIAVAGFLVAWVI